MNLKNNNIIKEKQKELDKLYNFYKEKKNCLAYCTPEATFVFGQGNPNAKIMFIGEAPGKEEDKQGIPFVGRSGQLLRKAIIKSGINIDDIYITNIVKCRPENNKTPNLKKIDPETLKILKSQINIIQPTILCAVGSISAQIILENKKIKITEMHGELITKENFKIIIIFHPAYILRNSKATEAWMKDLNLINFIVKSAK